MASTQIDDSRAQAHTLEGIAAALLVLMGLFLALQAVTTTPSTASTANQYLGKQAENAAEGVLVAADEEDSLRGTVLYWNDSEHRFHDVSGRGYYLGRGPPTRFGRLLNRSFAPRRIAFNVNLHYVKQSGSRGHRRLVYSGHPNEDAVTASRSVTLYDDDRLRDADGERTDATVSEASQFFVPDAAPNASLYNVVEVEVVVWRA